MSSTQLSNEMGAVVLVLVLNVNCAWTECPKNDILKANNTCKNNNSTSKITDNNTFLEFIKINNKNNETKEMKLRVKRQSGDRFTETSKMPQIRVLRLFLQMFKNLWAETYVGGVHPMHSEVPKPLVKLFKENVIEFLFPDVGVDKQKGTK